MDATRLHAAHAIRIAQLRASNARIAQTILLYRLTLARLDSIAHSTARETLARIAHAGEKP